MCPFCLSTIGLVVAGAVSSGGLTAVAAKLSRKEAASKKSLPTQGKEQLSSESRLGRK